ncbi:hypothetical protein HYX13_01350 [Candidatus Woesearchaeota archaeon]|nr:hypothetical protein [Candidatus Woesearchaeota archaeon]
MATFKHPSLKKRLIKRGQQTKWAPFWTVPKIYGKGKRVHPSQHTSVKRSWRKIKMKA